MEDPRKRPSGDLFETFSAAETANAPKKRKVRKGTLSCWECKRRKIRCTFAALTDAICDGCRSRQTRCISQEFYDEVALPNKKVDRLSRVESLVEQLVNGKERSGMLASGQPGQGNTSAYTSYPNDTQAGLHQPTGTDLNDVDRALIEAWPTQHDLDIILSVPVGVSVLLHGVICKSYSDYFSGAFPSPRQVLQLPSKNSHPVLVARRLLLLASFLQGIPPCFAGQLNGLSSDYKTIMSRVFDIATRLVTSNDELVSSLEGIECIMIESMYLNNAGNLRRAWLANRRAMGMAQMTGLHGNTKSSSMFLDDETRERIDPDYMWFRIVCTDRYLSLMLGLPQGSPEDMFASLHVLDNCMPVERMERLDSIAGGLILRRNTAERTDLAATHKIDKLLQEAAESMPPHWWVGSNPALVAQNNGKGFEESVRLMMQFAHYHLLVRLHLPYMLLPSSINPSYDYSKLTAADASRAIITQYIAFYDIISAPAYCRGVDFIAFVASTTLCLAHIEARPEFENNVTVFRSLQHQRLRDRGLLERLLEIMKRMAVENSDVVARKISSILQPLLDIEDNSFKGSCYQICTAEAEQESHCLGKTSEDSHELRIQIPHFGTIIIERRPQNDTVSQIGNVNSSFLQSVPSQGVDPEQAPSWLLDSIPGLELDIEDWALQGVDMALFSNLTGQN
ncbi:putative transcription factor [Talaromyces pinophilus]|nr:putative transcription factor [Talaromyces pinophilus]